MSEDDQDGGADEEPAGREAEASEKAETAAAPDGQPAVEDDQRADLSGLDVDTDDLDPNASEGEGAEEEAEGAEKGENTLGAETGEWGDMYVAVCTQATNGILEKHGDGHTIDESHFRSVNLDDHFSACMDKYAGGSDMEPEQALVVGTLLAVGGPVALHTDLLQQLGEEVSV